MTMSLIVDSHPWTALVYCLCCLHYACPGANIQEAVDAEHRDVPQRHTETDTFWGVLPS